jgi:hypothetical protein
MLFFQGIWDTSMTRLWVRFVDKTRTRWESCAPFCWVCRSARPSRPFFCLRVPARTRPESPLRIEIVFMVVTYFVWDFLYNLRLPFWGMAPRYPRIARGPYARDYFARLIAGIIGGIPRDYSRYSLNCRKAMFLPRTSTNFFIGGLVGGTV